MFNVDAKPIFTRTITFDMIDPTSGQPQSFTATFRALSDEERAAFDLTTVDGSKALLRAAVQSIDGLIDEDGKPAAYAGPLRERLLDLGWVRAGLAIAYFAGLNGMREGNSAGRPGAGPPADSAMPAVTPPATMQ